MTVHACQHVVFLLWNKCISHMFCLFTHQVYISGFVIGSAKDDGVISSLHCLAFLYLQIYS